MIKKIRKAIFRKQLRKNNFYEDVTFKNEEIEKIISEWIFDLNDNKQIELSKFTELFCNWEEIILPVRIKKKVITSEQARLIIIDSEEKEYYMKIHRQSYFRLDEYSIGRRGNIVDKNIDREFCYKIYSKNKIVLDESYAGLLNKDGTNKDIMATISYNVEQKIATGSIENKRKKIIITYKAKDNHIDNDVINYLLNIRDNICHKDVVPLIKDFLEIVGNREDIISVESRVKEKVYSKICIEEGKITEYSYSKEEEEGKIVMSTIYSPSNIII